MINNSCLKSTQTLAKIFSRSTRKDVRRYFPERLIQIDVWGKKSIDAVKAKWTLESLDWKDVVMRQYENLVTNPMQCRRMSLRVKTSAVIFVFCVYGMDVVKHLVFCTIQPLNMYIYSWSQVREKTICQLIFNRRLVCRYFMVRN